jgi:hypothetical protein
MSAGRAGGAFGWCDDERGCEKQVEAIDRSGDPLRRIIADVLRQKPGWKLQKRNHHQQQQIQTDENWRGMFQEFGDHGVREPYCANYGEAHPVSKEKDSPA